MFFQPTAQQVEVRCHRFPRVKAGLDASRSIVDHSHQGHALTAVFEPVVQRRVHLHQLAKTLTPRTTLPVLLPLPLALPQSFHYQPAPQGVGSDLQSLLS
jgi:hypothetical protein